MTPSDSESFSLNAAQTVIETEKEKMRKINEEYERQMQVLE